MYYYALLWILFHVLQYIFTTVHGVLFYAVYSVPCIAYCYRVSVCAPTFYLELLDKLDKHICRTVGPLFATSLELLAHRENVASIIIFCRYYFGRSELDQLVALSCFRERSTLYSDRLHHFSVIIPILYKDVYATVSFLAQLYSEISCL